VICGLLTVIGSDIYRVGGKLYFTENSPNKNKLELESSLSRQLQKALTLSYTARGRSVHCAVQCTVGWVDF
jgi:hypothetical protein